MSGAPLLPPRPARRPAATRIVLLALLVGAYVATAVASTVWYRLALNSLLPYPYVASQANLVLTTVGFAAGAACEALWDRRCARPPVAAPPPPPPDGLALEPRWWVLLSLGALDAAANVLQIVGADGMGPSSGGLMVVLAQGVVPLAVVLTAALLRSRFTAGEGAAALLVTAGVALALVPQFAAPGAAPWLWACVFFAANVPVVLNRIGKELVFAARPRYGVMRLGCLERVAELPLSLIAAPAYAAAPTSTSTSGGGAAVWANAAAGLRCLVLGEPAPQCAGALGRVLAFNAWSLAWLALGIAVVRAGGAALAIFANAVATPLAAALFAAPGVVGPAAAARATAWEWAGVTVLSVGTATHAWARRRRRRELAVREQRGPDALGRRIQ